MNTSSAKAALLLCLVPVFLILVSCVSSGGGVSPENDVPSESVTPEKQAADISALLPEPQAPDTAATTSPLNETQSILSAVAESLARRDFPAALALFDLIREEDAAKTEIQLLRASTLNSAGRPAEARAAAEGIISREPDNTGALLVLADSAALESRDRERRAFLEQIIKLDPKNTRALTDLGNIALRAQSLGIAARYFDQALSADSTYGEALVGRAIVYRYNREPKQAEQFFNRAVNLYPRWASPLHERARLYKGAGFTREALEDLDAAKRLEPDNYWINVDRGTALVELNRKQEALDEFKQVIAADPDNFLAYVYSAGIKDELGDYEGAERDYATLIKLRPEYYFAFEGLGMIKMRKHQWAEARDAFLSAYRQAPKEYSYALLAAVNWMRAGRPDDPKQFLSQVLRTVPRESLEYTMLRLFHDMNGDMNAAIKADSEKNLDTKARMIFYLANYYDIRGNKSLADKYFLQVQELNRVATPEWRINEWFLEERGLKVF
ncbi:MAG: tetratricopeptide repeat protein [Treponema sp.]|jgi:tetratricopeptide (TPR) repeat protein|nr:tetratricopeptide repeat protein [Treponema sp.]